MSELPFEITTRLTDCRGNVLFTAVVDGVDVAGETYKPGDGTRRRKLAAVWVKDDRLRNGQLLTTTAIARALEAKELQARSELDALDEDDGDTPDTVSAASYFDDDLIVELAWNIAVGKPDFIIFDRRTAEVTRSDHAETQIGTLSPPKCCGGVITPGGSIPGTVLVPTEWDKTGTDNGRLRESVTAFIERYVELPGEAAALSVEYVLLTWIHDGFDELPYLAFRTVDAGRGKSRALEAVGAACYRGIFCGGGSTAAATLRLLDIFGGTLVADEYDQRDTELACELTKIINQGFQRNRPLIRCDGEDNAPRAFQCFGPKLFALRKGFADDATETRIVSIHMRQRTRADIPINLPRARFDREALALRNKLLAWRFANHGKVTINPDHADPRLEDRYNQIGLPLMAVAGDCGRARVVAALLEGQADHAASRADSWGCEVFEAALAMIDEAGNVRPGAVAREVNRRRAEVEGVEPDKLRKPLNSWKVGQILKNDLELAREPKDNRGAKYRMDQVRVDELRQRFGDGLGETSQTSQRHSSPKRHSEIGLFDSASAESDVSDVSDVYQGMDGVTSTQTSPDDENNGSGDVGDTLDSADTPDLAAPDVVYDENGDIVEVAPSRQQGEWGAVATNIASDGNTDEASAADAMWADLEKLPPNVLRDRASRTDDPETKRRLLDLARREPATVQTDGNHEDTDAIPF